jgi:hypothetical protein
MADENKFENKVIIVAGYVSLLSLLLLLLPRPCLPLTPSWQQ